MYHYTESGLQNVWLANGYKIRKCEDGDAVAIADVYGLNTVIGRHIATKSYLSGKEFRFLRKELDLSQNRFASERRREQKTANSHMGPRVESSDVHRSLGAEFLDQIFR
ncbi:MAG: hypothetical protein IPH35_17395 [Rhodoferax sp.]|nr:hypothetical protein [Rhodoferax sp.]